MNMKGKSRRRIILLTFGHLLACGICGIPYSLYAQTSATQTPKDYVYKQKVVPQSVENYLFSAYYFSGKKAYNLRALAMGSTTGDIWSMKLNPSGTSFAVLYNKGGEKGVTIFDMWKQNSVIHQFKEIEEPVAMAYSSDARDFYLATADKLFCFKLSNFEEKWTIDMPFVAEGLAVSDNGYFVAAYSGTKITIWNLETRQVRKEFDFGVQVHDMAFSKESDKFGVLTGDELLSLYDTQNFLILQSFDAVGTARCLSFHPDGKYASVITGDGRIAILNLLDGENRDYVDNEAGGIQGARFVKDGKKNIFLAYNAQTDIIYKLMSQLAPNYTKLLKDELADRMSEWMKQMPGETLEEYNIRVNDETRMKQMRLFEEEIATRLADNMLQMSTISLGNYNPESGMLALDFNTMPSIYLNVPENELMSFSDIGNLEFRNARYGLTANDKFELVYADVYNKSTGKTYVFDNRERRSLDYLKNDENFVPLDLVQLSNMEMMKLEGIKDDIVNLAKQENKISDHTHISVNAKVVPDVDASGKKIMNYQVSFTYTVEPQFSVKEDFAAGKYKAEESPAAYSMLRIVKTAFEKDFAQYVKSGKKLRVNITGMADALPINGKINYDGCYGDFQGEPVYKNGDLGNITVTRKDGITENEQLAFLRATGVKEFIKANIPAINQMETNYIHHLEIMKEKGGAYRRINVDFVFVDAF